MIAQLPCMGGLSNGFLTCLDFPQAMKEAETGIYCGPLRLLAMEVFDSVNQEVCLTAISQTQCPL